VKCLSTWKNYYTFEEIKPHVLTHLTNLESNFKIHFPELTLQQHEWMWNPFAVTIGEKISHLSIKAKESLMELSCDIAIYEPSNCISDCLTLLLMWLYFILLIIKLYKLATIPQTVGYWTVIMIRGHSTQTTTQHMTFLRTSLIRDYPLQPQPSTARGLCAWHYCSTRHVSQSSS
jgi:hypothetical protein